MTRQPRRMRRREREALERLFSQLMNDLAAIRAPPLEWTVRSTRGPLRVSLWAEWPMVKLRSPAGYRWTFSRPIGPHLPIFVELTNWLCRLLQNPEPERKAMKRIKNVVNGWSTWVDPLVVDRATSEVNCGNVEDLISLMPEDWPDGAGPYSDESNFWRVMHH